MKVQENIKLSSGHISLYFFYLVFFLNLGATSFQSKYFGEIGISDVELGILNAMPAFVCVLVQPLWGSFSDKVKYKRTTLFIGCFLGAVFYISANFTTDFIPLLITITLMTAAIQPVSPVSTAISLEYVNTNGGSYGFIRLLGTLGYQIAALSVGFILADSLRGLLLLNGIFLMICTLLSFFLPPVEGHQHDIKEKVSFFSLLKDRRIFLMLLILGFAEVTNMYSVTFLGKLQGELGVSNVGTGIITVLSIVLEIPFLFFGERLYKKTTIWNWILIAIAANGLRWLGYAYVKDVIGFIIIGIPSVTVLACFEFFPALYMNEITDDKVKASAQSLLSLVTFGVAKIVGSLLGGFVSERFGIQPTYLICAFIMAIIFALSIIPCRRMNKAESVNL
ncbi:MAG: MFS transporter [Lachnospiraceae bacterium]|nr:MFS transporter [Lachnospiraceae bacterium]